MNLLRSRVGALVVILVLAVAYLLLYVEIERDPRPAGTLDDVRNLSERDDLNVVFILVDTLRADRLGVYGYERDTSPGIDYLARSGVRFAENRAQSSWTKASMASLWTSLYPVRTGVRRVTDAVADAATMPAEELKEHGFLTAGIWRNGWIAPNFNFHQGFDLYQNPYVRQAPKSLRREARAGRIDGTDIDLVYSALEFMRVNRDQRFFLYLHLMDVHQYVTVDELAKFGTTYSDSYDNSILWTDQQIRAIYGGLDQMGLRDKTLVVLASDHGEAFGEHGAEGHARDLHAEVTLTPVVMSFPFRLDPGVVVETPTQNVDIWPTIFDLLGLPPMEPSDGRSRLPEILGEPTPEATHETDVAFLDRTWGRMNMAADPILALRDGNLRIVYRATEPARSLLYDLSQDPMERRNLLGEHPDSERLQEEAKQEYERSVAWEGVPTVDVDDMSLKQLRALGYVVE
jgi:arylsulfatase A-like enzyme